MDSSADLGELSHVDSHEALAVVEPIPSDISCTLDAIVIPTARPAEWLSTASRLGEKLNCKVVVLCSGLATAEAAVDVLAVALPRSNIVAVDIPTDYTHQLIDFDVGRHPELENGPTAQADIARKRNIGILLAVFCGWRKVLFLDDDVFGLDALGVQRVLTSDHGFAAAGFQIRDYPDNSVVCHANRLSGRRQGVFVGAGALVVGIRRVGSFFPPVYNEDWLFIFDMVKARQLAIVGNAAQRPYEPFGTPRRAIAEEFGDLIGEGLFRLLHQGGDERDAKRQYWREALETRSRFINGIAERLLAQDPTDQIDSALMALVAAKKRLSHISPLSCETFVRVWRRDVETWSERLRTMTPCSLFDALRQLNLEMHDASTRSSDRGLRLAGYRH